MTGPRFFGWVIGASHPVGVAADRLTAETIARVQSDGVCFVGGAKWRDRWVMRLSIISAPTTEPEVDRACEAIRAAWRSVRDAPRD